MKPRRRTFGQARTGANFNPVAALDDVLSDVGLSRASAEATVSFTGQDPIVAAVHRLGACIGIPADGGAVAARRLSPAAWRSRPGALTDLRQAVHGINPDAFWHSTINGEPPPIPWSSTTPSPSCPTERRDGRWVMASGVYPHQVAQWCRFLDVPPDPARVAGPSPLGRLRARRGRQRRGAPHLRDPYPGRVARPRTGSAAGRPTGYRTRADRRCSAAGLRAAARPFEGIRVLSFTHAVAGPTVGRTLAEQGADVLCATRPNDYEHDFIYDRGQRRLRSAYLDLDTPAGKEHAARLLADADVVVDNYRRDPLRTAVSIRGTRPTDSPGSSSSRSTATARRAVGGARGIRHERVGRFGAHDDRRIRSRAPTPRHRSHQRLHHRLHGRHRRQCGPGQAGDRRRLVARHGQSDPDRHVVRLAWPRRPDPRRT